ncbi:hypothetical protein KR222_000648, partial [Zaprionus bogoriensis]
PDSCSDFCIWKLTRGIKRQPLFQSPIQSHSGHWRKSDCEKANAFAEHLASTFTPFQRPDAFQRQEDANFLSAPMQPGSPIRPITPQEVMLHLKAQKPKKTPGYDGNDNRAAKFLPRKGVLVKTFNAMLSLGHFPRQWKRARIVMIPKAGKTPTQIHAGVPQGSVLGPFLYTFFTSDMPAPLPVTLPEGTSPASLLLATYADDTAMLASHSCQQTAAAAVQDWLYAMERWTKQWNIAINTSKSACVTFS